MGWGKWVLVDFCRESEAKGNQLAAAPARGRGGARGLAWGHSAIHAGPIARPPPPAQLCRWETEVQRSGYLSEVVHSQSRPLHLLWLGSPGQTSGRPFSKGFQHWWNPSSTISEQVTALLRASVSPSCRGALTRVEPGTRGALCKRASV